MSAEETPDCPLAGAEPCECPPERRRECRYREGAAMSKRDPGDDLPKLTATPTVEVH